MEAVEAPRWIVRKLRSILRATLFPAPQSGNQAHPAKLVARRAFAPVPWVTTREKHTESKKEI